MNVSKKMGWIVVLSSLLVLLPALLLFYHLAKDKLLEKELSQHRYFLQVVMDEFSSDLNDSLSSLTRFDQLINRKLPLADAKDIALFDQRMTISEDGAWRNKREQYDGNAEAGLFLPPDYPVTEDRKRFYGWMLDLFESFGTSANTMKSFTNIWFLDHDRSELIYDLSYPDFIYLMDVDTDYTDTDWMTLASNERNPERETKWTPPLFDLVSKSWMVSVVYPLDINDQWVGTLGRDIELSLLFELIEYTSDKFPDEHHLLRDAQGHFILAGPWQEQLESQTENFSIDPSETELIDLLSQTFSESAKVLGEVKVQGQSYQAIALNIQPMNWAYVNLIPTNSLLQPLVEMLYVATFFLVATVLTLSFLINGVVHRVISKPIEQLVIRTRLFAKGIKPEPLSNCNTQEINELAQAMDQMNDDLDREAQRLAYMATHDELTKLPNRCLLNDRIEKVIAHCKRSNTKAAVLFLDLDQFKTINDSLGHSVGDKLLEAVAERIERQLRNEDTVARFGGDEFVVVVSDFKKIQDVTSVAEKLLYAINLPYIIDGYDLSITSSVGISICPDDSDNAEVLIQNADAAMYQSKKIGRNAFQFYTREVHEAVIRKLHLEEALRKALDEQQFVLYYQPKIDLATKQICGLEALIRWQHPEMGIVSPLEFIPLAEETGLIIEIGEWVIIEACVQMKIWSSRYPWLKDMAINLSARQFKQDDFVEQISGILKDTEISGSKINFEITESMLMDDVDAAITVLKELRALGVSISIDDFGTGFSSLSYLKHLPTDRLKIDRAFVREMVKDNNDQAIIRSILALAENLNLKVVAEGVEDLDQDQMLTGMKCDYAQGFLYSRPLAADEITELLEKQNMKGTDRDVANNPGIFL